MTKIMLFEEKKIYSVSELNHQVRLLLEHQFDAMWIGGEISNFKHYPSGHMYFSLKDSQAQIRCVMFAGRNRHLAFTPKDGLQVVIKAKASLYEDRGDYQLLVDYMEEAGDGALKRAFELLKQKLSVEGLFDNKHKKGLPALPHCIGLVTSSKGAAVHDILTTLRRRFPAIPVIIYPTQVQGAEAPKDIVRAIQVANQRQECDVLIVGRGGGSLEDLQAFNTEVVARAIYSSNIPIISAVGHEVDVTIADFVADVRAATPTAAAELVSPDRQVLLADLLAIKKALTNETTAIIQQKMQEIDWLSKRLKHPGQRLNEYQIQLKQLQKLLAQALHHGLLTLSKNLAKLHADLIHHSPQTLITKQQHHLHVLLQQLQQAMQNQIHQQYNQLNVISAQLDSMSPLKTLSRGYSILLNPDDRIITSVHDAAIGNNVTARLVDGKLTCTVIDIIKE
jgi:exodeoxyribonuclease VII large subunit